MNFTKLMQTRYTTKAYDPTQKVSEADIETLKEILRLSPSSINSQPWKFIFVSDETWKNKLSEHSRHNKEKVLRASHIVLFCRVDTVSHFTEKMADYIPQTAIDYYNAHVRPLPESEILAWLTHQLYIPLGIFLAACADLGIDSTAMEGIDKRAYTDLLGEKGYEVVFAVAVGYHSDEDFNQLHLIPKRRKSREEVIGER